MYEPESPFSSYSQILVRTFERDRIPELQAEIKAFLDRELPDTEPKIKNLRIGPGRDAKIEARFAGPDPDLLRELSEQAQAIMRADPEAVEVRDDWRQPVKKIRPIFNEQVGRELGIKRDDLAASLQSATEGIQVGIYRTASACCRSCCARLRRSARMSANCRTCKFGVRCWRRPCRSARLWTASRRYSKTVWCAVATASGPSSPRVTPAASWPTRCSRACARRSRRLSCHRATCSIGAVNMKIRFEAQDALFKALPSGFLLMIIVTVLLFSSVRQPLIIWLVVPFAIIGITAGLLTFDGSFDFMALLGALALIGLMIKNSIVLVEEIDLQIAQGKAPLTGVLDAAVSRMRPVMMAATTTILGLIPLLSDVFFVNMSITYDGRSRCRHGADAGDHTDLVCDAVSHSQR